MQELFHPNLHPLLVHLPVGLLFTGLAVELITLPIRQRAASLRQAGRWMILLGALALVPAALSGLYALNDVLVMRNAAPDLEWALRRDEAQLTPAAWEALSRHVLLTAAASAAVLALVTLHLALADRWRSRLYPVLLALLLASTAALALGAKHGGRTVYEHALGVGTPTVIDADKPALAKLIPPLQIHIVLTGLVIAAGMAALGATLRATHSPREAPLATLWIISALAALAAAALGAWHMSMQFSTTSPAALWQAVRETPGLRRTAHVVIGSALVALPLLLALLSRWAQPARWVIYPLLLLVLLAWSAQVWVGLLLLLDMPEGPLTGFNPAP